jgi:hypothetical protein
MSDWRRDEDADPDIREATSGWKQHRINRGYSIINAPESLYPWEYDEETGFWRDIDPKPPGGKGRKPDSTHAVRVIQADGSESWTRIENDLGAIREVLEKRAVEAGYSLEELARLPQGRPTAEVRQRRDLLSACVVELRGRGANLAAIAQVIGASPTTIHALEHAGRNPKN